MFSAALSIENGARAGAWLREHDSVTCRATWVGPNRALPVGPSGCQFVKLDCNGDYRGGRVGSYV